MLKGKLINYEHMNYITCHYSIPYAFHSYTVGVFEEKVFIRNNGKPSLTDIQCREEKACLTADWLIHSYIALSSLVSSQSSNLNGLWVHISILFFRLFLFFPLPELNQHFGSPLSFWCLVYCMRCDHLYSVLLKHTIQRATDQNTPSPTVCTILGWCWNSSRLWCTCAWSSRGGEERTSSVSLSYTSHSFALLGHLCPTVRTDFLPLCKTKI